LVQGKRALRQRNGVGSIEKSVVRNRKVFLPQRNGVLSQINGFLFQNKSFLGQPKGVLFQTKIYFGRLRQAPDRGACELIHNLGTPFAFYFFTHDLVSLAASSRILSGKLQVV
jgi:hypothetical protein